MGFHYVFITLIVVFGISIVGQSFGELIVLRQPREVTCLSEDDDSAFIWNDRSGTRDTLGFQPVKPKLNSDLLCAIWDSTDCRAHWENMTGWEEVESGFRPMAPVLDFRWEDFKEFIGVSHNDHSRYQYVGKVNRSSGSVAFSARGQKDLHILLCKNKDPTTGECFWMIIGGWEGIRSKIRFCPKGGPMHEKPTWLNTCDDISSQEHGDEGILDPFEWRTFRLTWSSDEKIIRLIKYIDHNEEPIFQIVGEGGWPDVSDMSIILDRTSRVRFHFYEYLLTEKKDSVLYSEEFHHYEESVCLKLLLGLCEKCKLSVKLVDNSYRSVRIWDISRSGERSAYDGTLPWRSVELSINLKDHDHQFERPFRLEIRTIRMDDEAKGQWAIDNFRTCNPGGQRRESTISWPQEPTKLICQRLSYNGNTVVDTTSANGIHANTHESQQLIDKLVEQCGSSCENFNENSLLCNSKGCTCNRSFRGTDCSETCTVGHYGYNCDGVCETCKIGTCDKITGLCNTRCPSNTLLPPLCRTEIEKTIVTNITDTTAVIAQRIELETSVNASVEVTIQVEFQSDLCMNFTAKLEESGMPFYYKSDVSNLTRDTVYKYRTIVSVILADDIVPVTSPEMNFTTTCSMQPNFTVTPGETDLTVVLENKKVCIHNASPDYLIRVYSPVNNISIRNHAHAGFPSVYDRLTPGTEYTVTIFDTRINKTVWSITERTLEAAPSEVENLRAESTTEYATTLRWDPPEQRNGLIRYYNVSLTGKLIACEEGEGGELRYDPRQIVNETSLTISGLHPYAKYTATVIAHTVKPGKSRTKMFQTLETNIPQSKFSNFTIGNNNRTLYWKTASDCTTVTGPTKVARLIIENIDDPTQEFDGSQQTTAYWHLNISKFGTLTPYTRYKVRLYVARNYTGPINLTNYQELTWRTSPIAPPPVEKLEIYDADIETNSISLQWKPPYPANGEIESYKVLIKQREALISTEDLKVLEERLKCEFRENYVCLKNFIFPKVIARNNLYKIEVCAFNKEVRSSGAPNYLNITPEIYEKKPSDPKNLTSISQDYGIVKLNWARSRFSLTKITGFHIKVHQASTKLLTNKTHEVFMVHSAGTNQTEYSVDLHLMTSTDYSVSIVAVNWLNFTSEESKIPISIPGSIAYEHGANVTIKQIGNFIQVLAPEVVNATKNTTVDVTVYGLMTCQAVNSPIFSPTTKFKKWLAAVYKLEEIKPKNLTIENIHSDGDLVNCTLDMRGTYYVELTAIDWYSGSMARLKPASPTSAESTLAWLVIFPIILAICTVLIFVAYRKCKRVPEQPRQLGYVEPISLLSRPTGSVSNSTRSNTHEVKPSIPQRPSYLEIIPPSPTTTPINDWPAVDTTTSSPQPEATEDQSSDHVYIVPNEPDSCCVSMENFADYAKSAATSRRLHSQFVFLHSISPSSPCEYGGLPENVPKNRNGSMPAFDHSRVVLEKIPDDPHSDYINASYIKGYKKERAYIAAQGPKSNTVNDFWRMVWQEEVRVICMLTNVIEGGETKCEKYWPDAGSRMKYGDFYVWNTNDQVYADYTFRTFELSYRQDTRKVTHLHYTGWPELGVPTYLQSLVHYLRKLEQTPAGNGPVVVHCSTGDDRTGTIILCAICLHQALTEKVIDVMAVTEKMRYSRANMVGTLQQYVLAHVIITESLTSWPTQIPCADVLSNRMNKLRIQLPLDMKRLTVTTWQLQALQSSAAASPYPTKHLSNDQNPEIVQDKPEVIYDDVMESERNQINAVIVDGVKAKKQYLACWLPSPLTLPNFWEFVVERDIKLIVILQCSNPRDPTCCDIMPDESITVPLLKVQVEKQTACEKGEYFTNEKLRITGTSEANARSQSLTVLTCKGWGCGTIQKPPTPTALISLWRASEKIPRKEGQTLVLCHDGVTGCGLYLAMSFLLERMAVERECDVISAVKAVRRSNAKFVQLTEQCEYLYDAAQAYAECFQCYANFS